MTATPRTETAAPTRAPWPLAGLLVIAAGTFLSVTTEMLPMGLLSSISRDLDVSEPTVGLLVTGYALMVALFAAPLGRLTARFPRRGLLVGTLVAYAASNVIMALSTVYPLAAVARLIGGLTHGAFWAICAGYAARMVTPDRVGRAVTLVFTGGTVAILLGVPAGTALGVAIGWRAAFAVLAGIALLLALVGWRLLPDYPGEAAGGGMSLFQVLRTPSVAIVVVTTAVTMLGYFSFYTYISPFLQSTGLSEAALSAALLGYGAAGAVGLLAAGLLVDKRPRFAMLAGTCTLTVALIALALSGHSAAAAVASAAVAGMALNALATLVQAAILRAAPVGAADTAAALNASAFNVGIGGGALVGGMVLAGWGPAALPIVAALLTCAGVCGVAYGRRAGFPAAIPSSVG
ncbi:MFS transporter [Catellatospora citrea]|uniref:MFS transporter n=1 Tax=Catellatospora citrea TaxID=53366 RepID=A0A8J3K4Q1_9ACTN|nr:MFS transporter [Catellatospora citrea]RKE10967.1 putative MFS family arabinose efflux permease [Catellatospora citrea]GIF96422.1 MFS transporter [Catellatospora citrea]